MVPSPLSIAGRPAGRFTVTHGPVLLLASLLAGCMEPATAAREAPARVVMTETVAFAPLTDPVVLTGTVRARHEVPMAFRVAGKIERRLVDAGARVSAGDLLATLDATDLKLALAAADADMRAAEAERTRATAEAARARTLLAKGHAAQAVMDRVETTLRAAEERHTAAQSQRALAANRLAYAALRADADGVVMSVSAEPGQVIGEGRAVLTLAYDGAREAVVAVPESRLAALTDSTARVTLWAEGDRAIVARLREVSPEADPVTRTFLARFTLDETTRALAVGLTARVELVPRAAPPIASLAATAVWWRGDAAHVWVVGPDGRLVARAVRIERLGAERTAVSGALAEGDRVVTMGVHRLEAQQPVRLAAR